MRSFSTYTEARDWAQKEANRTGISFGIEKEASILYEFRGKGYTVKMIPRPENRYGWELRCEAVEPEVTR